MAWIDDRIWCHPKFADLSDAAWKLYVCGLAYSTGFNTRGILTRGQQSTIGATTRTRHELIAAGLWDVGPEKNGVVIHDWDEHNAKRDARRAADRERKRQARSNGASAGQSAGQDAGASTVAARVDGSEGSEGSDEVRSSISKSLGLSVVPKQGQDLDKGEAA